MSNLDEQLRQALGREEPPEGFAERLLGRLPAEPPNVVRFPARGRHVPRFALAAAAALAVATGSVWLAIPRGALHPSLVENVPPPSKGATSSPESLGIEGPGPSVPNNYHVASPPTRNSAPRSRHPRHVVDQTPDPTEAEAIQAAEQLRIALQITGDKLNVARDELRATLTVQDSSFVTE